MSRPIATSDTDAPPRPAAAATRWIRRPWRRWCWWRWPASAVYWLARGGAGGRLIEIDRAPRQTAQLSHSTSTRPTGRSCRSCRASAKRWPGGSSSRAQAEGPFADLDDLRARPRHRAQDARQIRPYLRPLPPAGNVAGGGHSHAAAACVFFWNGRSPAACAAGAVRLPHSPIRKLTRAVSACQPVSARRRSAAGHCRRWSKACSEGQRDQVLMGVTGSGKTFTMANVIQAVQRPTLVLSHNKTLAAQLYSRVQGVLSAQRGALLRQLLRLLPARGLHSAARHLHRERRLDQPGDRPAAAGRDQRAGQPPRRDHRGQRVVHLRLGLARGLQGDDGRPAPRA